MFHIVESALADGRIVLALDNEGRKPAGQGRQEGEEADIERIAVAPLDEDRAQPGHDARHEEAGELVADGNAGIAHRGCRLM